MLLSCFTRVVRVALVPHSRRSCSTRVALVSLVSGTRVVKQTRSVLRNLCLWKTLIWCYYQSKSKFSIHKNKSVTAIFDSKDPRIDP